MARRHSHNCLSAVGENVEFLFFLNLIHRFCRVSSFSIKFKAMSSNQSGRGGISRVEKKLQTSLENSNYYEAHQMYRTLYSRYVAQERHSDAQNLMISGALLLFSKDEKGSAIDLSLLMLDSLNTAKTPVTEHVLEIVGKLHGNIDTNHPQIKHFEAKALAWTTHTDGVPKSGHTKLRHMFAANMWKVKEYCDARQHFLYTNDGLQSGEMLIEFSIAQGFKEEDDMFIAQFVLQLLCIRSHQTATETFTVYTKKHPRLDHKAAPPFSYPLLNFLFFLLAAIESRKVVWFTVLCQQYHVSLKRDPTYLEYLEKIGENFFELKFPKKNTGPKGIFGNLIQNLMEDDSVGAASAPSGSLFSVAINGLTGETSRSEHQNMTVEELD